MSEQYSKRFYKFENSFMRASIIGRCRLTDLQVIADKACRRWKVPLVRVKFGRHNRYYGYCFYEESLIELLDAPDRLRGGRNVPCLLHEVAHHIDWQRHRDIKGEDHGPKFAAICMDLYSHYHVIPAKAFRLLAAAHGLGISRICKP